MTVDNEVEAGLQRLADALAPLTDTAPVIVGIHTGGAWLARRLHQELALDTPLSTLNISFYRDDFSRIGLHPRVGPSDLHCAIDNRTIIVVDDVLQTGRTVRAAMNELFDFGRPKVIRLAVLVDRGGRELPIRADYVGLRRQVPVDRQIKLCGPDPLYLEER